MTASATAPPLYRGTMRRTRLTVAQVAERMKVKPSTWRAYVARGQAPKSDGQYDGRTPWWWSTTVDEWDAGRPYSDSAV